MWYVGFEMGFFWYAGYEFLKVGGQSGMRDWAPPHTEPKLPTRWSAVNLPNWLLYLYLADLLVLSSSRSRSSKTRISFACFP